MCHKANQSIISFLEQVTSFADDGDKDMIFFDFAKAFDKVPHQRLLELNSHGIQGKLFEWIKS